MTNTLELEAAIARTGIKKEDLVKELNLSRMGLRNKIKGLTEFKASEIMKLTKLLHLTAKEREVIFFKAKVDRLSTEKEEIG